MKNKGKYRPELTGLRAAACLMVFFHHYYGMWVGGSGWWVPYVREGHLGVGIFFTLSGFLITQTYYEGVVTGKLPFGEYWLRRFARIYPAYFIVLLFKLWIKPAAVENTGQVLSNLTLTQGYFGSLVFSGLNIAWSLSVEESFYLLAPLIFYLLAGRARRRTGRVPDWQRSAVVLSLVSGVLWVLGESLVALSGGGDFLGWPALSRLYCIFGRFPEFAFGILLAMALKANPPKKSALGGWKAEGAFIAAILLIGLNFVALLWLKESQSLNYGIQAAYGQLTYWLSALGTVFFILSSALGSRWVLLLFGNRVMEYFGKISFAGYLLQDGTVYERIRLIVDTYSGLQTTQVGVATAALLVFSALTYECIERPMHRWILARGSKT